MKYDLSRFTPKRIAAGFVRRLALPRAPGAHFGRVSYSQEGEDLILARAFEPDVPEHGFYVDIGAHHPFRFSNTYLFYQRGWNGINIDPLPGAMEGFSRYRPRDINLELAVSDSDGEATYYMFNEPALNGFNEVVASERDGLRGFRLVETKRVRVQPLKQILSQHVPAQKRIDFMNVDVEGAELAVLRSNDWTRYRPRFVLCEVLNVTSIAETIASPLSRYMRELDYAATLRCGATVVFRDVATCD